MQELVLANSTSSCLHPSTVSAASVLLQLPLDGESSTGGARCHSAMCLETMGMFEGTAAAAPPLRRRREFMDVTASAQAVQETRVGDWVVRT